MAKRNPGFSLAEHNKLGERLYRIRNELMQLLIQVNARYPKKHRGVVQLHRAYEAVDRARSALDDAVMGENPERDCRYVYYPGVDYGGEDPMREDRTVPRGENHPIFDELRKKANEQV